MVAGWASNNAARAAREKVEFVDSDSPTLADKVAAVTAAVDADFAGAAAALAPSSSLQALAESIANLQALIVASGKIERPIVDAVNAISDQVGKMQVS